VDLHGWGIGGNRGGNPAPATSAPTNQADRPFKPVLAAGYTYTHDELGHFTFPLPPPVASGKPWVRMPGSSPLAIIYSPDNGIHKVIFGYNPNMVMSPREHAQDMEGDLLQNKTSYRQKSMVDGTVHGNLPATEWQYFFTGKDDKVLHHSIEELFNDHGTEYDVLVDYPESDWQTCYTRFHDILNGFTGDS
jgi:hypothetical protein